MDEGHAFGVILLGLCVGCARQPWPEPPVIDQATYQKDYQKWLDAQQETARDGTKEVGIWPLQEGETAFGSDASLPIALPGTGRSRIEPVSFVELARRSSSLPRVALRFASATGIP